MSNKPEEFKENLNYSEELSTLLAQLAKDVEDLKNQANSNSSDIGKLVVDVEEIKNSR